MESSPSPLLFLTKREFGFPGDIRTQLFNRRLQEAKNLFKRDLVCHYGCVNAIEFSSNGEYLVSGGDDRRVMLWKFGQTVFNEGKPESMKSQHQSNIFCLGMTCDNQKIYSGGNDDQVIVHNLERQLAVEVLPHQRAVCGLGIDPFNQMVITTAGNDGRLLLFDTRQSVHESLVISRSRKAFHAVMFHPTQMGVLVSANARDGVALWDLRTPKHPVLRYSGNNGTCQNSMSVRFNSTGNLILALRRRLPPALYSVHASEPVAEFYHQDYYNSCTMKSCCFAGDRDQYVVSGSDDFNLYMWKVPDDGGGFDTVVEPPHMILYGHRSIVNQVRYNRQYCLLASSGVEKIIKVWSAIEYPSTSGDLLQEAPGSNHREVYSHEDYVMLVHHSEQHISHHYVEQSTSEDPRMMAFFDSLVQRELEGWAEETDSRTGSSSDPTGPPSKDSDSSDSDQIVADFLPLPPRRTPTNGGRSQRCSSRIARLLATRYSKNHRLQKRGTLRRSKQSRAPAKTTTKSAPGSSVKGKRAVARNSRASRRPAARAAPPLSAPSSERTDSDEPTHCPFRNTLKFVRPLRRRFNISRALKRKSKGPSFRKMELLDRINGNVDNNTSFGDDEDNLAIPSTSTGYRGQSSSNLFRIAEVDSDDDHSPNSRPVSPRNASGQNIPQNLVSIIPTPLNGSRDNLGESLGINSVSNHFGERNVSPVHAMRPLLSLTRRYSRRSSRVTIHHSDSSESPPLKEQCERSNTPVNERLLPLSGYSRSVARLMNETNESELESSCSTESSALWPMMGTAGTPDSGVCTAGGSGSRGTRPPPAEVSDDPDFIALKFRQRVKKIRRNYRNHIGDSDSN